MRVSKCLVLWERRPYQDQFCQLLAYVYQGWFNLINLLCFSWLVGLDRVRLLSMQDYYQCGLLVADRKKRWMGSVACSSPARCELY
jgi:hypothetical protein